MSGVGTALILPCGQWPGQGWIWPRGASTAPHCQVFQPVGIPVGQTSWLHRPKVEFLCSKLSHCPVVRSLPSHCLTSWTRCFKSIDQRTAVWISVATAHSSNALAHSGLAHAAAVVLSAELFSLWWVPVKEGGEDKAADPRLSFRPSGTVTGSHTKGGHDSLKPCPHSLSSLLSLGNPHFTSPDAP